MTADLRPVTVVAKGAEGGRIQAAWGADVPAVAKTAVSFVGWTGMQVRTQLTSRRLGNQVMDGQEVGSLRVTTGSQSAEVGLVASHLSPAPSMLWRLRHV
jgi:hypothetical protein